MVPPSVDSTNAGMSFLKSGLRRNPNAYVGDISTLDNYSGIFLMVNCHGHFLLAIFKYIKPSSTVNIGAFISATDLSKSQRRFNPDFFCHPIPS